MAPKYNRKKQAQHNPSSKGNSKQLYIIVGVIAIIIVAIVAGAYFLGVFGSNTNPQTSPTPDPTPATANTKVLLKTNKGDITIQLYEDKPITTQNFLKLVALGKYDNVIFHRILKDFMIQSGTINKNGEIIDNTWPTIKDEIGTSNHNYKYTIAMANTGEDNSATTGFFINTVDNSEIVYADGAKFDDKYTAFGIVIEGQDIVDTIANTPVTTSNIFEGEKSQPTQTITITSAKIIS